MPFHKYLSISAALSSAVLLSLLSTTALAGGKVFLHLPLDGEGRKIRNVEGKHVGWHHVSAIADQDNPESVDPTRYRVEGRFGGGVRYYAHDVSYSLVKAGLPFRRPIKKFAISFEMKVTGSKQNHFASLLSMKADADKSGFALFLWGHQVRFCFGDGKKSYDVRFPMGKLKDGKWHTLEVEFDEGNVAIWIDYAKRTPQKVDAKAIFPPRRSLYLSGYPLPGVSRTRYAFDGWLDEVTFGESREAVREYLAEKNKGRNNQPLPPAFEYTVQPIDGNERFFGGQRVLHTFHGHPVPLSFIFRNQERFATSKDKPHLVMYVPQNVKVVQVYQSHHGEPEAKINTDISTVQMDGQKWTRHVTKGIDLTKGGSNWVAGPAASWAFDADRSVDEARIRYGVITGGEEGELTEAKLRFMEMPEPVSDKERGRFHVFGYFNMSAFAFPDESMWQPMADMLKSIGLTGKGRFYEHTSRRSRYDEFLKKQGFTLYEIALWQGPNAYDMAVDPVATTDKYVKAVGLHLKPNGSNEGVIFDYEPWQITYKASSFRIEIRKAFAKWAGLKHVPEKDEILEKLRREWTEFWLNVGENAYAAMSKAVRTNHPDKQTPRIAYTYFFPYDNEQQLYRRFWGIPKDPRKSENHYDVNLLGMYITNDRKLVDQVRLSQKHLKKRIWGISAISRVNPIQENYTSPENSLSPQRLEQKIVLCGALGLERHAFWPGRGWLDGKHLEAIGNASRFIWKREAFYFDGKSALDEVKVQPPKGISREQWAYTAHVVDGRLLVTVFNFSDKPITFRLVRRSAKDTSPDNCTVEPHGYSERMYE